MRAHVSGVPPETSLIPNLNYMTAGIIIMMVLSALPAPSFHQWLTRHPEVNPLTIMKSGIVLIHNPKALQGSKSQKLFAANVVSLNLATNLLTWFGAMTHTAHTSVTLIVGSNLFPGTLMRQFGKLCAHANALRRET